MRAYQQIARDMQVLPNFVAILVTVFRTDLILKWFNCNCILRFWMHTWLMRKFQMNMLAKLRFHDCEKRVFEKSPISLIIERYFLSNHRHNVSTQTACWTSEHKPQTKLN
ncbi:uncharacterized protein LOC141712971 isoform X1 [Apium graveolens]|uniref:uncharacterized protein LOC141712971 isoform X1 n=1 Tax=Apium graveolens TaxID=4045 RepID=UPI003D78E442